MKNSRMGDASILLVICVRTYELIRILDLVLEGIFSNVVSSSFEKKIKLTRTFYMSDDLVSP